MTYKVVAPLVLAVDQDGHTHHVYQGGTIEWLSKDQEKHFLAEGLISKDAVIVPGTEFLTTDQIHPPVFVEKPAKVAKQSAWVDYAVSQGANREEAEGLTKQELQDLYGD